MQQYIARRLLLFIPTLFGLSVLLFVLMRIVPGDPALVRLGGGEGSFRRESVEAMRKRMGLDRPIIVQYINWLGDLARLDLGFSYRRDVPVLDELRLRYPVTLQLALMTFLITLAIAIPVGVLSGIRQDSWLDYLARGIAIMGLAMPTFWVGLLLVLVLCIGFHWFPPLGFEHLWETPWTGFQQLIWPALGLGFHSSGFLVRITRTQVLEVNREDYIRTAYAKGLAERVIIFRHVLKNALLPVVTASGLLLGHLLSGTIVIELIFNLPGLGRLLLDSIYSRDLPVMQAVILAFALVYLVVNLLVDLSYGWLDPRVSLE